MIDNGADVIGHCANESGTGAINPAKDAKVHATGDLYDQERPGPTPSFPHLFTTFLM